MAPPCSAIDGAGAGRQRPARADARVVWFAHECARNGVDLDGVIRSAERSGDLAMADFFRRAQREVASLDGSRR
jgi:hypothetical protein